MQHQEPRFFIYKVGMSCIIVMGIKDRRQSTLAQCQEHTVGFHKCCITMCSVNSINNKYVRDNLLCLAGRLWAAHLLVLPLDQQRQASSWKYLLEGNS